MAVTYTVKGDESTLDYSPAGQGFCCGAGTKAGPARHPLIPYTS